MGVTVTIGGVPIGDTGSPRVEPTSLQLLADDANGIVGPSTASFTLTWNPRDAPPSLLPFTPVQVDVDGHRCWSGYVWTSNITGYTIAVSCNGQKTHLDGDLVTLLGLDTSLTEWQGLYTLVGDTASLYDSRPNTDVPPGPGAELASQGAQGITLTWPATATGHTMTSEQAVVAVDTAWPFEVGALLIAVSFSASIAGRFRVWGTDQLAAVFARSDWLDIPDSASGVYVLTPLQPHRYLKFGWGWSTSSTTAGGVATVSAVWLSRQTVSGFQTATDLARQVASLVPQLSSDLSQTVETPTGIGQAAWPPPGVSPASVLGELASYDDPLLGVDAHDRLVFQPRSAVPTIELGTATPVMSEAPSDPSGLVSDVVVSGSDVFGQPYSRRFTILDLPETPSRPATDVSIPNAWAASAGSSGAGVGGFPATGYLAWRGPGGSGDIPASAYLFVALTGTFHAGESYLFTFGVGDANAYPTVKEAMVAHCLDVNIYDAADLPGMAEAQIRVPVGSNGAFAVSWTPRKTTNAGVLSFNNEQARPATYSDGKSAYYCLQPNLFSFAISELATPNALSVQRVTRTGQVTVPTVVNDDIALALAQSYLRGAIRQGYTGVRSAADGGAVDAVSHAPLSGASVLAAVGQYARVADRQDPATGAVGAIAYVSSVVYDRASRTSQITLGQRYGAFNELLAKVSAL